VVLGHGISRFFGPYGNVEAPSIAEKIFRVLFGGYGSPAVMVFFVLSGLFIGQSVLSQINKQQFCLKKYLARRVVRLWLVLIPALILTYFIDSLGLAFFSSDGIYQAKTIFGSLNPESLSFSVFVSNLFFVQTIIAPSLGSNGALWSLSNEFWYYVMFPLLILPFVRGFKLSSKFIQLSLLVSVLYFVGVNIASLFTIWLLGVGLLFIPISKIENINHKHLLLVSLCLFISTLLFIRLSSQLDSKLVEQIICGVEFSIFCLSLMHSDKFFSTTNKHRKISYELAGFSYTLYLIHTPILCFARGYFVNTEGYLKFNLYNAMLFLVVIMSVLAISYCLAKLTEVHTHKVYKFLKI